MYVFKAKEIFLVRGKSKTDEQVQTQVQRHTPKHEEGSHSAIRTVQRKEYLSNFLKGYYRRSVWSGRGELGGKGMLKSPHRYKRKKKRQNDLLYQQKKPLVPSVQKKEGKLDRQKLLNMFLAKGQIELSVKQNGYHTCGSPHQWHIRYEFSGDEIQMSVEGRRVFSSPDTPGPLPV